ncbi:MAG: ABC transporter substrate-binding protein, partial [Nitrosopumilus sp.]
MKKLLVFILALLIATIISSESFAEKSTFFDSVKFIQYLDENTALEEVRNGNLDVYYYRISSDRLESNQAREGLQVFDSTGGSYSILVNPAESEKFNPFSTKEIRFALNYLVDRKLIVNELMGGYGAPIISYYSPSDPEYLTIIEELETFSFKYNPALAEKIISEELKKRGAIKFDEKWEIDSKPIEITIFIRSDDPVRKSIGEILAVELQRIGFTVKKDFGDLNKAFVVVYGSNPSDLKWSLYTEGWGRSSFVKYDSVGLGQMYSPWFSSMPGFNDPTYWNYENDKLDEITQKIY